MVNYLESWGSVQDKHYRAYNGIIELAQLMQKYHFIFFNDITGQLCLKFPAKENRGESLIFEIECIADPETIIKKLLEIESL